MRKIFMIAVFLGCLGGSNTFGAPSAIKDPPQIRIFPNPFNDELQIQLDTAASVVILNVIGEIVFEQKVADSQPTTIKLNLGHLPNGIYLIRTKIDEKIITQRVVKK